MTDKLFIKDTDNKGKAVIGLVPLYLKLYDDADPQFRKPMLPLIQKIKDTLEANGVKVVVSDVVTTHAGAREMARLFDHEDVDAVFTCHLTYSPSLLSSFQLGRTRKPLFILDTTPDRSFEKMADSFLMNNHGIHGVMDLTSVLTADAISYTVLAGHCDSPAFEEKIKNALVLVRAIKEFKGQRIGITGKPFAMMGDFSVPFNKLESMYGIKVVNIPEREILESMTSVSESEVTEEAAKEKTKAVVEKTAARDYPDSVRVYLALKKIVSGKKLSAYTMNFLDFSSMAVPFYAVNRLMADGLGYAGEGDVLTASLGRAMNALSGRAMFSEFFCPDWKRGLILMSHMGEIDPRFAVRGSKIVLKAKKALMNPEQSLYHRFSVNPGKTTFVNISKTKEKGFKLVTGILSIVKNRLYDVLDCPQFVVRPDLKLENFLETYAEAGGGHHIYLAAGDRTKEIAGFGRHLGMKVVHI